MELIRDVVLVAEQQPVDAGRLEDLEVAPDDVEKVLTAACPVVPRSARQPREMEHRDHRFDSPETVGERGGHGLPSS